MLVFLSKPLFTQRQKLNLKNINNTLLDIYRISVGEKLKTLKKIVILKYVCKQHTYPPDINTQINMTGACRIFEDLVYFTTRVPDTSDPRPIKSNKSDIRVVQGRHE